MPLRDAHRQGPWPNRELLMLPLAGASVARRPGRAPGRGTGVQGAHDARRSRARPRPGPICAAPGTSCAQQLARPGHPRARNPRVRLARRSRAGRGAAASATAGSLPSASAARAARRRCRCSRCRRCGTAAAATAALTRCWPPTCASAASSRAWSAAASSSSQRSARSPTPARAPGPAALAAQGATLMASMAEAAHALNLGEAAPDAAITLGSHHLLLRAVPARRGLALHAVLDRAHGQPDAGAPAIAAPGSAARGRRCIGPRASRRRRGGRGQCTTRVKTNSPPSTSTGITSFGPEAALQDQLGHRVLDALLDRALQRPRAEHRVEADLGQARPAPALTRRASGPSCPGALPAP